MKFMGKLLAAGAVLSLSQVYCTNRDPLMSMRFPNVLAEYGDKLKVVTNPVPYRPRVEYSIVGDGSKEQLMIKLVGVLKQPETPVYSSQNSARILMRIGDHTVVLIMPDKNKDMAKDGRPGLRENQDGQWFVVPPHEREAFNQLHTDVETNYRDSNGVAHGSSGAPIAYLLRRKVRLFEAKFSAVKGVGERDLMITVPVSSEEESDKEHSLSTGSTAWY